MEEFIYNETKYIKRIDHKDFVHLMLSCDFMPENVDDDTKFNILFKYLGNLTIKAPNFLPPYEYTIRMIAELESNKDLEWLQNDLVQRWFEACERIAEKEDIFNKMVEWTVIENRPLIRGLFNKQTSSGKLGNSNWLMSCSARYIRPMRMIILVQDILLSQQVRE